MRLCRGAGRVAAADRWVRPLARTSQRLHSYGPPGIRRATAALTSAEPSAQHGSAAQAGRHGQPSILSMYVINDARSLRRQCTTPRRSVSAKQAKRAKRAKKWPPDEWLGEPRDLGDLLVMRAARRLVDVEKF